MFKRAKEWMLANLKTGDNNIQFDVENMTIHNSSTIVLDGPEHANMNFKVHLYFKDGRYKFRFDNIIVSYIDYFNGLKTAPYGFKKWSNESTDQAM